jgi:arginase family enzyme
MDNEFLLSPYFLDSPAPLMDRLATPAWIVHFDADIIDKQEAPAMMYPVAGGPSVADLRRMAEALHHTHTVVAVSMTVWDLARDADGQTERACLAALDALVDG